MLIAKSGPSRVGDSVKGGNGQEERPAFGARNRRPRAGLRRRGLAEVAKSAKGGKVATIVESEGVEAQEDAKRDSADLVSSPL